jgi:transcription factor MYB, plant
MGIDPATHQLPNNTMVATSQSTTSIESAKSSDTGDVQSLKECSQETVPVPTDSSEQSSWPRQSSNACSHDLDPVMNWQLEVDLPIDEPWLNFTSGNSHEHGIVADPLATDGAMNWLLDFHDFGIDSSNSVGNSMVRSSNGSNF